MSLIFQFDGYSQPLESSDNNTVKAALQNIFELLVTGKRFPRSARAHFTRIVKEKIASKSQKVRKWAYHCACFYQDQAVCQAIIKQLKKEKDKENIVWALTALSKAYCDVQSLKQCVGKRHDEFAYLLSEDYLVIALTLFGNISEVNVGKILDNNNSFELAALTKFFGYSNLEGAHFTNVTQSAIRELEGHDDPYVREYAYWAQGLNKSSGNYISQKDDPIDTVRKHQICLQVQNGDEDFVTSILRAPSAHPQNCSTQIKNGILRGIQTKPYSDKYITYLTSWFEQECEESILIMLIDYMLENCASNQDEGTYFDVISDALADSSLASYVERKVLTNKTYGLSIAEKGYKKELYFLQKGGKTMANITVNGSIGGLAVSEGDGDANVVTVVESWRNLDAGTLRALLSNVRECSNEGLPEEDKKSADENINIISEEARKGNLKNEKIQSALKALKAIKGTAEFIASVIALANFLGL